MLAVIREGTVAIYRRTASGLVLWRVVDGDAETIRRALEAAREVRKEGLQSGSWLDPSGFAFEPAKPVPAPRVVPRVLGEDRLDSLFWDL